MLYFSSSSFFFLFFFLSATDANYSSQSLMIKNRQNFKWFTFRLFVPCNKNQWTISYLASNFFLTVEKCTLWLFIVILLLSFRFFCKLWAGFRITFFLAFKGSQDIVNWVEWLWNPSDSFVTCFCGPESAQRSKEFLSFWLYWPIKTLH